MIDLDILIGLIITLVIWILFNIIGYQLRAEKERKRQDIEERYAKFYKTRE